MKKRQLFFRFALVLTLGVISYFVFARVSYPMPAKLPHMDKIAHCGGFFVLSWLTFEAFRWRWFLLVPIMTCYAILIEVVQSYLPYRRADLTDFAADMLGVALFYAVLGVLIKLRCYPR